MRYCLKCGAELREGAQFCPQCGARIGKKIPNEEFANHTQADECVGTNINKSKIITIFLIVCGMVVFILAFLTWIETGKDEKKDISEDEVRELLIKGWVYEDRDTIELDEYIEPKRCELVAQSYTDMEIKELWEECVEEGMVSGEYSFKTLIQALDVEEMQEEFEYYQSYEFSYNHDTENDVYRKVYDKYGSYEMYEKNKESFYQDLEQFYEKECERYNFKIENCSEEDIYMIQKDMYQAIYEGSDERISYDVSKWKEVKKVSLIAEDGEKYTGGFVVKVDGEWKILDISWLGVIYAPDAEISYLE